MAGDADRADPLRKDTVEEIAPTPYVDVSNVVGVIRLGYGSAARHLLRLLVPAVVLFLPEGVVLGGLIVTTIGRDGLIANGGLEPLSVSSGLAVETIAALLVGLVTYVIALAAMVVMSAGLLLGQPVRPGAALRAAAGRPVALAVLGALAVTLGVLSFGASNGIEVWTQTMWISVVTFIIVLGSGLWLTLGLPIALLDGRGTWRSVGRAWSVSRQRGTRNAFVLMLGVLVGPGLFVAGVHWALSPLSGVAHPLLANAITGVASLAVVPFQAMTLTVVALNQRYPAYAREPQNQMPLDLVPIAGRLSAVGPVARPRPRSAVLLVAALPLPGLLYSGYVWLNPLDLPTDHVMRGQFSRHSVTLHLLPDGRPMEIADNLSARVCADQGCGDTRLYDYHDIGAQGEKASVTLPDGTVAAAAWFPGPGRTKSGERQRVLRLFPCSTGGCGGESAVGNAPIVDHGGGGEYSSAAAMTVTRDGILIASVRPEKFGKPELVRLIRCADIRCAAPDAVTVTHLPFEIFGVHNRPIAVAAGQSGRPVMAYENRDSGAVTVISCDSIECHHPRVTQPSPPVRAHTPLSADDRDLDGIDLVVPPDDRPVLTFRNARTGAAQLLHCRTSDCAHADNTALTGPGPWRSWPALTLDRDGRPLTATYDHGMLVLIACRDFGCDHRRSVALAKLKNGPGYLDLAIGRDRRPVVLWSDETPYAIDGIGPLHLTTCTRPRCGIRP
jgi:hypothetical protein